jgi:hypothetical protein
LILKAIDIGASVIFVALCARAFCVHFYKDIKQPFANARRAVTHVKSTPQR